MAIIHSSWEGAAEPWVSRDALLANPRFADEAQQQIDDMIRRPQDDKAFPPKDDRLGKEIRRRRRRRCKRF